MVQFYRQLKLKRIETLSMYFNESLKDKSLYTNGFDICGRLYSPFFISCIVKTNRQYG